MSHTRGKVFVTGGSGHLGANLVRRLLADGEAVRVLAAPGHNNTALDGLDVEIVEGDIRDPDAMARLVSGCQRVYHTAAKISTLFGNEADNRLLFETNVLGTRHVLDAARRHGVEKVVVTGSFSAVGYDPETSERPVSARSFPFYPFDRHMPYAYTKMLANSECLQAAFDGLPVVVATSCAIVGPHDYLPSRMGSTLCAFASGRMRAYMPGAFEFVAARDIVQGHVLAMEKGRSGRNYIFATAHRSLDDMLDIWSGIVGRPKPRMRLPRGVMTPFAHLNGLLHKHLFPQKPTRFTPLIIEVLKRRRHADWSLSAEELGYAPTSLEDASREAFEFFLERGMIDRATLPARRATA